VPAHAKRRQPRAHWILLILALAMLLGELCINGYVRHVGAEGAAGPTPQPSRTVAPPSVTRGGPVVRLDADGVHSQSMPARTIALTFDDGPDPRWTPQILDILARHHAHATFFVIGSEVDRYPDLARRILAAGDEIGSHTFTHADLVGLPGWRRRAELALSQNAIAGATGRLATLMRPPYSSEPDAVTGADYGVLRDIAAAGYLAVLADHDTQDWRRPGAAAIVRAATPAGGAGAVVMMHDGGGDRAQTVTALDTLLTGLSAHGYRFTTVSAGLGLPDGNPAAPTAAVMRGDALRWAQVAGGWLTGAMTVVIDVAIGLALLRFAVQLVAARIHMRRTRRAAARPRRYLGPVSVIVPAFNEAANIAATVRSLYDSDYPQVEVIVVDDGSSDHTAAIVAAMHLPGVRVIRQPNTGKPGALNTGIGAARGDLLVLVDGDTVFEPDAIGRLVQPFIDRRVGAVSGNTKVANRRRLLGRWQHLEYVIGFNLDRRMFDLGECMPTVPGAIGAFRRATLTDVGGVPADTLAEDTDLTMAVIGAGWRVVYQPDAIAWTEAPSSVRQLWRQRYRWAYGTMQAMWKHRASLTATGPAGRLGRRGLTYLLLFQVLLPLLAPAVDVYAIYGLLFLPLGQVAAVWLGFLAVQGVTAAYALHLDGERWGPLWTLPLQQVVYRQMMYLVVVQSTVTAITGSRLRWHRSHRTGAAQRVLVDR
jgi:cellulose synthase/poly-beta-1,6-N-acetylglucosamine synthase-like glycosyltransferase/peptidoglycan/xylan/chitin deacetylase (PgdA/CDA1 family)